MFNYSELKIGGGNMRFISFLFIILLTSVTLKAEKVHSNEVPSESLSKNLKRVIPSFKMGEGTLAAVIESLREESRTSRPGTS